MCLLLVLAVDFGPGCPWQDEPDGEKRSAERLGAPWNHMRQHVCYKAHPVIYFLSLGMKEKRLIKIPRIYYINAHRFKI